jgi:probable F420-dependent oxidoreductase
LKPFRFGALPVPSKDTLPVGEWTRVVQKIEKLGYSTVFRSDHFRTLSYEPIAMLASAASVTKTLNIGSLVFAVDFRHPAILAKAGATLHLLSSGRFEFGIGAGYWPNDYSMTGIPLTSAGTRVARLEEALKIIKSMWTQDRTSFSGKHYQISKIEKAGELPEGEYPNIMIGGGGRKMMKLAAKYADIVGIFPSWRGSWGKSIEDQTTKFLKRKISSVKKAAKDFGRDPDNIEFQLISLWTEITDKPEPIIMNFANSYGIPYDEFERSDSVFIGSESYIISKIKRIHEETGINYFVFRLRGDQIEKHAKSIVQPLTTI